MAIFRTYSELCSLRTFEERFEYLRLNSVVGEETFGAMRDINQRLYQRSPEWRDSRREVILRDNCCDLGCPGREISGESPVIHHLNPITIEQVLDGDPIIFDPEYLICTIGNTHRAIHFGDRNLLLILPENRRKGDTVLWTKY